MKPSYNITYKLDSGVNLKYLMRIVLSMLVSQTRLNAVPLVLARCSVQCILNNASVMTKVLIYSLLRMKFW